MIADKNLSVQTIGMKNEIFELGSLSRPSKAQPRAGRIAVPIDIRESARVGNSPERYLVSV